MLLTYIHVPTEINENLQDVSNTVPEDILHADKKRIRYKLIISRIKHSRFAHVILCILLVLLLCIIFRNETNSKFSIIV